MAQGRASVTVVTPRALKALVTPELGASLTPGFSGVIDAVGSKKGRGLAAVATSPVSVLRFEVSLQEAEGGGCGFQVTVVRRELTLSQPLRHDVASRPLALGCQDGCVLSSRSASEGHSRSKRGS